MYGSSGDTSSIQCPTGILTWLRLSKDQRCSSKRMASATYPTLAMSAKSSSVMNVSQCCFKAAYAMPLSWYRPKVYSSTIRVSFVLPNREGVVNDYRKH